MSRLHLLSCLVLSVLGCALWNAYFIAHYDANEYMPITEIRTNATQHGHQCDNAVMAPVNAQAFEGSTEEEQFHLNNNNNKRS